jgi:hypothetical protein
VRIEHASRKKPWRSFEPGKWYHAQWEDERREGILLHNGKNSAVWPADHLELRNAEDDAWEIRSMARTEVALEGQAFQIPGRIAECPEGHSRTIPTRFDAAVVLLTCRQCGRPYRLLAST